MTSEFQEELEITERRIELLFGEVEHALQRAVTALAQGDERLASETISHDDLIDQLVVSTEEAVILTIARNQPVASDLRYLLSVLRISNDLERCGDLALRVCKQVFDKTWMVHADEFRPHLERLGEAALRALRASGQAWSERDDKAWMKIEEMDVEVDGIFADFLDTVEELEGPRTGEIAIRCVIAGQALERISDHAVSITQRIRYLVSGEPEGLVGEIRP
ncbi:MAG: phosphate signaling complex protein PhoU [Acidimicrobiia bacterium]|nr:phosphate signaling complex protein PhoU [Acidimicrobiia bacterium]